MNISRRHFLKASSLAWGALGLDMLSPGVFQRRLLAAELPSDRKLIFIFQNGGNDGVNTLIPTGDSQYNTDTRPTLYIPPNAGAGHGQRVRPPPSRPAAHDGDLQQVLPQRRRGTGQPRRSAPHRLRRPVAVPFRQPAVLAERRARETRPGGGHVLPAPQRDARPRQPGKRVHRRRDFQFADGRAQGRPALPELQPGERVRLRRVVRQVPQDSSARFPPRPGAATGRA
jgi:hypothetical protein